MNREINIQDLPRSAQELTDIIGLAATLEIVRRWGGTRLWIPRCWDMENKTLQQLIDAIGKVHAFDLWDHCKNSEIDIPRCERAIRTARDREIWKRYRHETAKQLALEYKVTERTIYNIVSNTHGINANNNQGDLFT